jgi:predicted ATPase/class 3 adenylate cyclase
MRDLPSGTVTFLFTDIEGSTALWERNRGLMAAAVDRHLALLRAAIEANGGVLFKVVGDAVQAAFATAPAALAAAVAAQRSLLAENWEPPEPLRVRMALHTGAAEPQGGDYRAPALHRLAHLLAAGHGGQVLLSEATWLLVRDALPAGVTLRDLGEHRLRDLLTPERIFQLCHPDLPDDFPPLATLDRQATNLRDQPSSFVGRRRELAEVTALLQRDDVRLLTLTGPGGVGKTRLGLQAAAGLVEQFADGVFVVELAPLTSGQQVPAAIAGALGLRESPGQPLEQTLIDHLHGRRLLLVLDNVEHLSEVALLVSRLLEASPGLKLLATSRSPLRLRAEREFPVAPLTLPDPLGAANATALAASEAIQLFLDRATRVRPAFVLTDKTGPVIAEIVRRLDGLPLAIELAAARMRLLTPESLRERLSQRLDLLSGGPRDAPARQQTLRNTIAWSHDLLAPDAQLVFRRLAVFVGGFSLEAAEYVGGTKGEEGGRFAHGGPGTRGAGGGEEEDDERIPRAPLPPQAAPGRPPQRSAPLSPLDLISSLVDESLVRQLDGAGAEPRYDMLETIRTYALERLQAAGEDQATRQRHAEYFLALAERAAPALQGPGHAAWLDRLEAENDNLRAALDWTLTHDPGQGMALGANVWRFWLSRGHLTEGRGWLERLLAHGDEGPPAARVRVLYAVAGFARTQGDYERSRAYGEEGLTLAREQADRLGTGMMLLGLGSLAGQEGDPAQARVYFEEALALFEAEGDLFWAALGEDCLAVVALDEGDNVEGERLLRRALEHFRAIGYVPGVSIVLEHLADVARTQGDLRGAAAAWRESLALYWQHQDRVSIIWCLEGLAVLASELGEAERAARLFGAAVALRETLRIPRTAVAEAEYEAGSEMVRAMLGEEAFARALSAGRALPLAQIVEEALTP